MFFHYVLDKKSSPAWRSIPAEVSELSSVPLGIWSDLWHGWLPQYSLDEYWNNEVPLLPSSYYIPTLFFFQSLCFHNHTPSNQSYSEFIKGKNEQGNVQAPQGCHDLVSHADYSKQSHNSTLGTCRRQPGDSLLSQEDPQVMVTNTSCCHMFEVRDLGHQSGSHCVLGTPWIQKGKIISAFKEPLRLNAGNMWGCTDFSYWLAELILHLRWTDYREKYC